MLEKSDFMRLKINGEEYPLRCDLAALEKLQDLTGDLLEVEDKLKGFHPRVDADGVIDRSAGYMSVPDPRFVLEVLKIFLEEGKDVTKGDYMLPTDGDLVHQEDYSLPRLAAICLAEFEFCLQGKATRFWDPTASDRKAAPKKTKTRKTDTTNTDGQ